MVPIEASDDPHRLARLYIRQRCHFGNNLKLRFWRSEWHRWNGLHYAILPDTELVAELTVSAKAEMDRVNIVSQKIDDKKKKVPTAKKITRGMLGKC